MISASSILATTAELAQLESTLSLVLAKEGTLEQIVNIIWLRVHPVPAKMVGPASIPTMDILADVQPIIMDQLVQKVLIFFFSLLFFP